MRDGKGAMFALISLCVPLHPFGTQATTPGADNEDLYRLIHQELHFSTQKFTQKFERRPD
jgi:hypothetical protein